MVRVQSNRVSSPRWLTVHRAGPSSGIGGALTASKTSHTPPYALGHPHTTHTDFHDTPEGNNQTMEDTQSSTVNNAVGATAGSGPQPGRATGGAILTALDGESSQGDDHPSTADPPMSQTVPTAQLDAYYKMKSLAATSSRSATPSRAIESNALVSYSSLEPTYDFDGCTAIESNLGSRINASAPGL